MFDFLKIKQTISDLGAELKKLRAEREGLMRDREDLQAAPICQSDLLELIDAWIDRRAADFPKRLEAGIDYYRRHALVSLPEDKKTPAHPLATLTAVSDPNAQATLGTLESSLFFVLRGPIKAGLREAVATMDFSDCGRPRAERLEMIAAIDKRIGEIDAQELELVEQAEKAGLRL
jgi:hypothetical protein